MFSSKINLQKYNYQKIKMNIVCPKCNSNTTELVECDICNDIGCHRCIRKKSNKWVCFKCKESETEQFFYPRSESESKTEETKNIFSIFD